MSLSGRFDALATTNTVVQATNRANITGLVVSSEATAVIFMQIFDALASGVTLGSTVADMALALAPEEARDYDLHGAKFDTAFSYAIVTTSTGTAASAANVWVQVVYV